MIVTVFNVGMVTIAVPLILPRDAVMVTEPPPIGEHKPEDVTVAIAELEDDHVTEPAISFVVPSLYAPVAANCCVVPSASVAEPGVTEIDDSAADGLDDVLVPPPLLQPTKAAIVHVSIRKADFMARLY